MGMKRGSTWVKCLAALALGAMVAGCAESYDQQTDRLYSFAKRHQIGSSSDFYLVKRGLAGPDRVALVFGMASDSTFCFELAQFYMEKYPADTYWCEAAN